MSSSFHLPLHLMREIEPMLVFEPHSAGRPDLQLRVLAADGVEELPMYEVASSAVPGMIEHELVLVRPAGAAVEVECRAPRSSRPPMRRTPRGPAPGHIRLVREGTVSTFYVHSDQELIIIRAGAPTLQITLVFARSLAAATAYAQQHNTEDSQTVSLLPHSQLHHRHTCPMPNVGEDGSEDQVLWLQEDNARLRRQLRAAEGIVDAVEQLAGVVRNYRREFNQH